MAEKMADENLELVNDLQIRCHACSSDNLLPVQVTVSLKTPPMTVIADADSLAISHRDDPQDDLFQIKYRCAQCDAPTWVEQHHVDDKLVASVKKLAT